MPQTVNIEVYEIGELSGNARERAREWFRQNCMDNAWYDSVYEDFETIARILGITLDQSNKDDPAIYFRGFSSQGDGACFEGRIAYAQGVKRKIRQHAPKDEKLHELADRMHALQRPNFFQLTATVHHNDANYYHKYTMDVEVERDNEWYQEPTGNANETMKEIVRDLAQWLYDQLESDYEGQTADEAVDETIEINDWRFTEDGEFWSRAGARAA